MPTGRLNMRRIRDVLRLKFAQGLSERAIATSLGLGKGSVGTYLRRARDAGLNWPLPDGLDDDGLELLLFPASPTVPAPNRPVPDWSMIDKELRKRGVTLVVCGIEDELKGTMTGSGLRRQIGEQNVEACRQLLSELDIAVTAAHCGGAQGRRMKMNTLTGAVTIEAEGPVVLTTWAPPVSGSASNRTPSQIRPPPLPLPV